MVSTARVGLLMLMALGLAACDTADEPAAESGADSAAAESAAVESHYKPVATVRDLMRGPITLSAEVYWESVSMIVDAEGAHQNEPETDEEWFEVWSAAISLAESGNLLLMPTRNVDEPEWRQFSEDLIDAGLAAAQVAADRDFMGVLEHGGYIYEVCLACHETYVPALRAL